MGSNRRSPTLFRRRGAAIACFVLLTAALTVAAVWVIGMLTRYDYAELLPEDAILRVKLPEDGYLPSATEAPEAPEASSAPTAQPMPTPMPTPAATPVPIEQYSTMDARMLMPSASPLPGEAVLTGMRVSEPDNNQTVVVTGWAFLDGCDAEKCKIYLVVSTRSGYSHRFYLAAQVPGSTGIRHDPSRGQNLDRADFRAVFSVQTYEEGPYRLGALVVSPVTRNRSDKGYFDFGDEYDFYVKSNRVQNAAS